MFLKSIITSIKTINYLKKLINYFIIQTTIMYFYNISSQYITNYAKILSEKKIMNKLN